MKEYLQLNKQTYDALAAEYERRVPHYVERDKALLTPVIEYLKSKFHHEVNVLDIGPGAGLDLSIVAKSGFNGFGVDISPKMIDVCRRVAPNSTVIQNNFLDVNLAKNSFHGVIAKATLHLFEKEDAYRVLKKIANLLVENGMLYISTTLNSSSTEGVYPKLDYVPSLPRYRKNWTRDELITAVSSNGFILCNETYDEEPELSKTWINLYLIKA